MQEESCAHNWEMINIQPGYIITEKCFHCAKISTYFTFEDKPPLEEYRDGEHFWNIVENAQSIRFDLMCNKCGTLVEYEGLSGLMMCTGCDKNCKVDKLMNELAKDRIWVYVAFGFFPTDERDQPGEEKISILEDYFNQRRKSSFSKIKIVSNEMIDNISTCYAEVIKDVGMLSLTPPEEG